MTPAQREIMEAISRAQKKGVGRAHLRTEAARELGISPNTVSAQLCRLCKKLGITDWRQAYFSWQQATDPVDMSQEGLGRRWNAPTPRSPLQFKAMLDDAETKMRAVLLDPRVNETWPKLLPELLDALESLAKARKFLL